MISAYSSELSAEKCVPQRFLKMNGPWPSVPHFHIHIIPGKTGDGIDAWLHFDGAKEKTEEVLKRIRML